MNNKNGAYMVFLLILIGSCYPICSGQESIFDDIGSEVAGPHDEIDLLKNVHKFVADAKSVGVLDEELIRVLVAYSILNKIPVKEVKKFLVAAKFADLSNTKRSVDFTNDVVASNKTSSLLSVQRILLILACLVVIGACSAYIYKEVERQYKEYQQYRAREDLKANVREVHDTFVQGVNDTYNRVKAWWNN
ncbi:MAG: hypothetical protein WC192_00775 [Candidatus Babeliales bacterium]|jgi:hypothetical protein